MIIPKILYTLFSGQGIIWWRKLLWVSNRQPSTVVLMAKRHHFLHVQGKIHLNWKQHLPHFISCVSTTSQLQRMILKYPSIVNPSELFSCQYLSPAAHITGQLSRLISDAQIQLILHKTTRCQSIWILNPSLHYSENFLWLFSFLLRVIGINKWNETRWLKPGIHNPTQCNIVMAFRESVCFPSHNGNTTIYMCLSNSTKQCISRWKLSISTTNNYHQQDL